MDHRASFRTGFMLHRETLRKQKNLKNSKLLVSRQNLSLPLLLYVCTLVCICVCVLCIHVYVCVLCIHVCVFCAYLCVFLVHTHMCVLCIPVCVSSAYTYVCSIRTCVHTFSVPSMHRYRKRRLGALIYHSTPDSDETASFSEPGARLAISWP